jgi:lipoprotein signal peptidase
MALTTLELRTYHRRAALMLLAASAAVAVDFWTKHLAVALAPDALRFHISPLAHVGLGELLILVLVATSLVACVLPFRLVAVGAGVALGGALGNLLSRRWWEAYGGSPDFIRFADGSVGNVADLFIAGGAAMMLLAAVAWLLLAVHTAHRP